MGEIPNHVAYAIARDSIWEVQLKGDQTKMIVVILAGGLGTRMGDETTFKPKPMVEIGPEPTLWHLIKFFEVYGIHDFIIAGGYKVEAITEYFSLNADKFANQTSIRVVDTGPETQTGGRLLLLRELLDKEDFLCTYGDGLANVKIDELISFHLSHGAIATVTGVQPVSRFGVFRSLGESGMVLDFEEKPKEYNFVNGGFFIFKPKIFDYLSLNTALEGQPLTHLVRDSQIYCFKHHGFWRSMDTYRENRELHQMWEEERAPWKIW